MHSTIYNSSSDRWLCSSNNITNILIAVIRLPIARTGRKVSELSCPMSMSVSELCLAAVAVAATGSQVGHHESVTHSS